MVSSLSRERGRNSEQIWTPPLGEPTAFLNVGIIIPLSSEKMREDIVSSYSKNENLHRPCAIKVTTFPTVHFWKFSFFLPITIGNWVKFLRVDQKKCKMGWMISNGIFPFTGKGQEFWTDLDPTPRWTHGVPKCWHNNSPFFWKNEGRYCIIILKKWELAQTMCYKSHYFYLSALKIMRSN